MKRETAELAAVIVDRIQNIEKKILEIQSLINCTSFKITGFCGDNQILEVKLEEYSVAKEVFSQDILEYYINTLNLEMEDEMKKLDNLL